MTFAASMRPLGSDSVPCMVFISPEEISAIVRPRSSGLIRASMNCCAKSLVVPPNAELVKVRASARNLCGKRAYASWAIMPPMLWPTTTTGSAVMPSMVDSSALATFSNV